MPPATITRPPMITIQEQSSSSSTDLSNNSRCNKKKKSDNNNKTNNNATDYYSRGSIELATETALTLERLEARRTLTKNCERLVLVLVGLPARGKSFLARKLTGFLNWHGIQTQVFNVGKYRRQVETCTSGADFFDAKNTEAAALREKAAELALRDMLQWLDSPNNEDAEEETSFDDEDETEEDDDDDGGAVAYANHRRTSSTMNPEGLKSERYTRITATTTTTSTGSSGSNKCTDKEYLGQIMSVRDLVSTQQLLKHERIAIFDATNSTDKRRQWILEECTLNRPKNKPTGCVFIESICDDQELLMENYVEKINNSPDYKDMEFDDAINDIRQRVTKYEDQYETITNDELSYIKIFNLSSKILANQIYGRMSKIIMPAMMAWNIGTRPIFLCRPGQTLGNITTDSEDYVASVLVGDDDPNYNVMEMSRNSQKTFLRGYHLGKEGKQFSQALLEFCRKEGRKFLEKRASIMDMKNTGTSKTGLMGPQGPTDIVNNNNTTTTRNVEQRDSEVAPADGCETETFCDDDDEGYFPLQIYTSTMPRATQTVKWTNRLNFELDISEESNLNPLDKGDYAGKELDEIRRIHPIFYQKLVKDAFHARFPGGESYCDLIKRLDAVIVDLEQQVTPTLVVSHVSVLQMLIAYFRNSPVEKCMDIDVPLHTVIQFTPARGGGWSESIHTLAPVNTEKEIQPPVSTVSPSKTLSSSPPPKLVQPIKEEHTVKKNVFFAAWPFFHKNSTENTTSQQEARKKFHSTNVLDERTHRGHQQELDTA